MSFCHIRVLISAVIAAPPMVDEVLAERTEPLIAVHPTFGYRRLWARPQPPSVHAVPHDKF